MIFKSELNGNYGEGARKIETEMRGGKVKATIESASWRLVGGNEHEKIGWKGI